MTAIGFERWGQDTSGYWSAHPVREERTKPLGALLALEAAGPPLHRRPDARTRRPNKLPSTGLGENNYSDHRPPHERRCAARSLQRTALLNRSVMPVERSTSLGLLNACPS